MRRLTRFFIVVIFKYLEAVSEMDANIFKLGLVLVRDSFGVLSLGSVGFVKRSAQRVRNARN
jgi:hypothetical protein